MKLLRTALIHTYQMAIHAKGAHWNVMAPDFPQLHEFFGELYEDLNDAVDVLAEDLRTLGSTAPADAADLVQGKAMTETTDAKALLSALGHDNTACIQALTFCYKAANASDDPKLIGIANRMQDRLLAHQKHGWMLKATLEGR